MEDETPEGFEIQASLAGREELANLKARLARAQEALDACRPGNMMHSPPSQQTSTRISTSQPLSPPPTPRSQYAGEGLIGEEEGMPSVQPLTPSRRPSSPPMRRSEERGESERRLLRTRLLAKYPPQSAGACGMTVLEVAWREAESRAREDMAKAKGQYDGQVTPASGTIDERKAGDSQHDAFETPPGGAATKDRFVLIAGASERHMRQEKALKHSKRNERRASRQERTEHEESRLMANVTSSAPANLERAPATAIITAIIKVQRCVNFGDPAEARSDAHFVDDEARQQALPSAEQDAPQNVCLQQEACADHVSESLLYEKSSLANRDALDDGHLSREQTPLQSPTKASPSQQYNKREAGQEVKRPVWMSPRRPSWMRPRLQPSHQVSLNSKL
jgi:hypothetical protein